MAGRTNLTSSSRRIVMVILSIWSMVLLIALRGELSEAKSELQIIRYRYPQLFPERMAWDGGRKRFIIGSTVLGKLVTLTEAGVVEDFVLDEDFVDKSGIHGVFVDVTQNRVLAVVEALRGNSNSSVFHLVAYDLGSKKRLLNVALTDESHDDDSKGFFFKDVCADDRGNAYVTESVGNSVWIVTSSGKKYLIAKLPQFEVLVNEAGFAEAGINGIVYTTGVLLVNQFNSGALFKVKVFEKWGEMKGDTTVQQVKIDDGHFLMSEADGMTMRQDGTLVVVSPHTAWLLSSRNRWDSASLEDKVVLETSTYSTSVATKDLKVYVLASYLQESMAGIDREKFHVEEIDFPNDPANSVFYILLIFGMFGVLVLFWRCQLHQFNKAYTKKNM